MIETVVLLAVAGWMLVRWLRQLQALRRNRYARRTTDTLAEAVRLDTERLDASVAVLEAAVASARRSGDLPAAWPPGPAGPGALPDEAALCSLRAYHAGLELDGYCGAGYTGRGPRHPFTRCHRRPDYCWLCCRRQGGHAAGVLVLANEPGRETHTGPTSTK